MQFLLWMHIASSASPSLVKIVAPTTTRWAPSKYFSAFHFSPSLMKLFAQVVELFAQVVELFLQLAGLMAGLDMSIRSSSNVLSGTFPSFCLCFILHRSSCWPPRSEQIRARYIQQNLHQCYHQGPDQQLAVQLKCFLGGLSHSG